MIHRAYKDANGNFVVQTPGWENGDYYIAGKDMHQLNTTESSKYGFKFEDTRFPDAEFVNEPGTGVCCVRAGNQRAIYQPLSEEEMAKLSADITSTDMVVHRLPKEKVECRYFFQFGEEYVYVDRPQYNWRTYKHPYTVFRGKPGKMVLFKVEKVEILSDADTIIITMEHGHVLQCAYKNKTTWNGEEIVKLDNKKDPAFLEIPGVPSPVVTLHTPCVGFESPTPTEEPQFTLPPVYE